MYVIKDGVLCVWLFKFGKKRFWNFISFVSLYLQMIVSLDYSSWAQIFHISISNFFIYCCRFPFRDKTLLAKWTNAVKRKDWTPTIHSKICSKHFLPEDFYPDQSIKRLREDAVPSVFAYPPKVKKRRPPKIRQPLGEVSTEQ